MKSPLIIQFTGYKNTGKTTWVCRMTERFKQAGCRVGTIKHDAHDFQMDMPGTDTWKHQTSGADVTAISSSTRSAIIKQKAEPLEDLIEAIIDEVDIILVEGFKSANYPKVILASETAHLGLLEQLTHPIALVYWPEASTLEVETTAAAIHPAVPTFALDDYDGVFQLLEEAMNSSRS